MIQLDRPRVVEDGQERVQGVKLRNGQKVDVRPANTIMKDTFTCRAPLVLFFFFQAEDGIRDLTVTGVQTCALPICFPVATVLIAGAVTGTEEIPAGVTAVLTLDTPDLVSHVAVRARNARVLFAKIGRASCRERV